MARRHAVRRIGEVLARTLLVAIGVLGSASLVAAQGGRTSVIHGVVTDDSDAAMPGVTVNLTSPALQVPLLSAVTGTDGTYRFGELPAGTFRVSFELAGFSNFVREDVRLTIGFTARIDAKMAIGTLTESVTVSGQSPVVDLTATGTAATFTNETLNEIPRGRDLWAVVEMAPGVSRAGAPDVGGSRMASRPAMETYGVEAQPKLEVEGINISTGGDANSAVYLNYFGFDEIQFKTSGTDAEVGTPGMQMIAVLRSGSNDFHGRYEGSYQGPKLQSNNLTDELRAQGLNNTEPLKHHYDLAGDLGGRIIRNRLWFYGGVSKQNRVSSLLGFVENPGPDNVYLTGDEPLADFHNSLTQFNVKLSWQISQNNRLIGVYQRGLKQQGEFGAGRLRPLEATRDYYQPTDVKKVELQSTPSPKMLFSTVIGYGGYYADYSAARLPAYPGTPSAMDRESGLRFGSHEASEQRPRDNWQGDVSFSYFPDGSFGGRHELKTGVTTYFYTHGTGYLNHDHGNYELLYDRVLGVPNTPAEITIKNYPLSPRNKLNVYAWYVKDTWRVNDSLTLNLGLRYERQTPYIPAQSKPASPQFPELFPAGDFGKVDLLTWQRVLPRLGASWSLNSRTVVKASAGLYNYLYNDADVGLYNLNALETIRYRWRDTDGNRDYTPGEVNLGPGSPDYITQTGANTNIFNPDLKQPMTTEATLSFERELATNVGLRLGYVFRHRRDAFSNAGPNVLRPYDAYTVTFQRPDPGPDGVIGGGDDGDIWTVYDFPLSMAGPAFVGNKIINQPYDDKFHTMEAALTKRFSNKWSLQSSFWMIKNHAWVEQKFENPNFDHFPLDETWNWGGNLSTTYTMPWDLRVSGFIQSKRGARGQRTYIFRQLPGLATATVRMEEYGAQEAPAMTNVNLRFSKDFTLRGSLRIGFDADMFNVLNAGTPSAVNWVSGPTFGYATAVLPARVIRLGGRFEF